jgi:hypothetical protein
MDLRCYLVIVRDIDGSSERVHLGSNEYNACCAYDSYVQKVQDHYNPIFGKSVGLYLGDGRVLRYYDPLEKTEKA